MINLSVTTLKVHVLCFAIGLTEEGSSSRGCLEVLATHASDQGWANFLHGGPHF